MQHLSLPESSAPSPPTYVAAPVFTLGSLSCPVCGHLFPLSTNRTTTNTCHTCGAVSSPSPYSASTESSIALFSSEDLSNAQHFVRERCGDGGRRGAKDTTKAGKTEVDNRVIEEAFCERCAKHTACKTFSRQTRSADEGQTIFYQCTVCASEWQQNS